MSIKPGRFDKKLHTKQNIEVCNEYHCAVFVFGISVPFFVPDGAFLFWILSYKWNQQLKANRILTPQGDNVSPDNENKSLDITFEMNGDFEASTAAFIDPPEYETNDFSLVEV